MLWKFKELGQCRQPGLLNILFNISMLIDFLASFVRFSATQFATDAGKLKAKHPASLNILKIAAE